MNPIFLIQFIFTKICLTISIHINNQSLENAVVAFIKGANERNAFFEKKNQRCMTNKSGRKKQRTNNLKDELIWG